MRPEVGETPATNFAVMKKVTMLTLCLRPQVVTVAAAPAQGAKRRLHGLATHRVASRLAVVTTGVVSSTLVTMIFQPSVTTDAMRVRAALSLINQVLEEKLSQLGAKIRRVPH